MVTGVPVSSTSMVNMSANCVVLYCEKFTPSPGKVPKLAAVPPVTVAGVDTRVSVKSSK